MPKFQFAAREIRYYSDTIEADSLEDAEERIKEDISFYYPDYDDVEIESCWEVDCE